LEKGEAPPTGGSRTQLRYDLLRPVGSVDERVAVALMSRDRRVAVFLPQRDGFLLMPGQQHRVPGLRHLVHQAWIADGEVQDSSSHGPLPMRRLETVALTLAALIPHHSGRSAFCR